jgi:Gas vesicle protein
MSSAPLGARGSGGLPGRPETTASLADILERVLDKGIVIAGDIQINLLDIELLTIKLRLLVASVDKAREMGINWWEGDPSLQALDSGEGDGNGNGDAVRQLEQENRELHERLERLERMIGEGGRAG